MNSIASILTDGGCEKLVALRFAAKKVTRHNDNSVLMLKLEQGAPNSHVRIERINNVKFIVKGFNLEAPNRAPVEMDCFSSDLKSIVGFMANAASTVH